MSERKSQKDRLKEVDRQLEAMRQAIGEDNWSESDDSSDSEDSQELKERAERAGRNSAMESARKFLWDEADEEDDHLYLGGPFPTKPKPQPKQPPPPTASIDIKNARESSGANMFRPSIWDSMRSSYSHDLDQSINLQDTDGLDANNKKKSNDRPSVIDMFFGGGKKKAPTKKASTAWYDADTRDADDMLDRKVNKKNKTWSYLACLWNFVLWSLLLGLFYIFGYYIYDFVQSLRPAEPVPVDLTALEKHAKAVHNQLVKHGALVEDASLLQDPNSPQAKALEWVINDSMETSTKAKDRFLWQRYSLAVIYHSLHGQDWIHSDGWMTNEGYCSWYGVQCLGAAEDMEQHHGNGPIFELNLSSNQVKGNLPIELNGLEDLFFLDLQDNQLDGTIPANLGGWTGLRMFSVGHNDLYGTIPVALVTTSPDLHILNAAHNGLTGTIPPEIGGATKLRELRLEFNGLYGHLPDSLRHLDRLETLHLAGNKLGGSLPNGIYDMARLETLYLHDNSLTGHLSNNFAMLTHLELLTLHQNQLVGTVPDVFSRLRLLQQLQLHSNELSGTMPHSVCSLTTFHKLAYLSVSCARSEDEHELGVHCECCTACK